MSLMSQAEYARHRGVGKSAVSNWKRDGLLIFAEDEGGRLRVHVERTDARLNARIDPMRGRPSSGVSQAEPPAVEESPLPGSVASDVNSVRAEHLREQLIGQRLKNAETLKDLVPLSEMVRQCGTVGRMLRERVHSMHRGLAERIAAEREPRAVDRLLEEETDKLFGEMADLIDAGALDHNEDADAEEVEASQAGAA